MKHVKLTTSLIALTTLTASAAFFVAQANTPATDLAQVQAFGFKHFHKVEFERDGRIEVDGWTDTHWYVEAEFGGNSVLKEQRERRISSAWGLTYEQLQQVMTLARESGLATIEEVEVSQSGRIEVEGKTDAGFETEFNVMYQEL